MTLLLQVSDPHVLARGELMQGRVDTSANFRAALQLVGHGPTRPDLVLLSGDLVNDGTEAEYQHLAEISAEIPESLTVPMLPVMGNHDNRTLLRRYLSVPDSGEGSEPVQYTVCIEANGARQQIIVLDTSEPGRHGGLLCADRLAWLDTTLAADPEVSTIIVQHHPPITSGIDFMDQYGLEGADEELEILSQYGHIAAVLCGHLHRPISARVANSSVVVAPSCAAQVALDLVGGGTAYTDEPGMVAWHRWTTDELVSHLAPVHSPATWVPTWAESVN